MTLQLLVVLFYPTYGNDLYKTVKCNYITECENELSFSEFYSEKLFNQIKHSLNYDKDDKVIAFGIHPSILAYNGMYTMDGYHNAYYQNYKERFRELIEPGLILSDKYRAYFDNWGGRAYIFSEEVNYDPHRTISHIPIRLPINFDVAKRMNIKYVISNEPILLNKNIAYIGNFTDSTSPYNIKVYRIIY